MSWPTQTPLVHLRVSVEARNSGTLHTCQRGFVNAVIERISVRYGSRFAVVVGYRHRSVVEAA